MSEGKDQDNLYEPESPFFKEVLKLHPLLWTSRHHEAVRGTIPASFEGHEERVPEIGTLTKGEITKSIKYYTKPDFEDLRYLKSLNPSYFVDWLKHLGQFEQVLHYLKKDKRRLFSPEEIESLQSNWENARKQISGLGWMDEERSK